MSRRALIIYCGLLQTVSAFSIDIMLPAFPVMVAALDAPYTLVQMSVTIYLFSFGIGQLVFGPLSDRMGRRPAILIGLLIYFCGSIVALMAGTIEWVLIGRILQGLGGAAGPVIARAIIRDHYSGQDLARQMAIASAVFAIGPIVAPLLGVGLATLGSWRLIFLGMTLFSLSLIVGLHFLPETLKQRDPTATSPSVMLRNARQLFIQPQSRFFLCLSAVALTLMLLIVTNSPRVYETAFGITGTLFAILFSVHGLGIIAGQYANTKLIGKLGTAASARLAACVMTACCLLIAVLAWGGWLGAYSLSALLVLFATSFLIVYSNSASLTLDPHGEIAGFASAFWGFSNQVIASTAVSILTLYIAGRIVVWAGAMVALSFACLALLSYWMSRENAKTPETG